jgi:hypothetical protein
MEELNSKKGIMGKEQGERKYRGLKDKEKSREERKCRTCGL